jgi:benzoyl-CoA reductase/2-hydroxyglutaryl-CoA dehydratase subunit BcrC/BadD/HgdB
MRLPQAQDGEEAKGQWLSEVKRLKEEIERRFGKAITDEDLRKAIKERNLERLRLKEFY